MDVAVVRSVMTEKRFGFLKPVDGSPDVFFHESSLQGGLLLDESLRGKRVRFSAEMRDKGPRAVEVLPE